MTAEPGWEPALDCVARSRLTLLLGGVDSGKTSLAVFFLNGLLARGYQVGVVDADLGQSEVGPPTTIGLGQVTRVLARLSDAAVVGLSFIGSTSPQGHVTSTIAATQRLARRAFALGFERVVVDTCGLIDGDLGRALKRGKIETLDPDLVIALQREEECEPILGACAGQRRPEILRLPVGALARSRSTVERRRYRQAAVDAYFRAATVRRFAVSGLALRLMSDRSDATALDAVDHAGRTLVGLDDASGDTLGLGAFRGVDAVDRTVVVDTPVRDDHVAGLRVGRHVLHSVESVR
jgi:polynucleotide 5'-kinase involved in rRNA processing